MRAKRVLLVTTGCERGGAETIMAATARHLDHTRYTPILAVPEGGSLGGVWRARGWTVIDLPAVPRLRDVAAGRRMTRRLETIITDTAIDLVHTHGVAAQIYGAIAAARHDRPVVWHMHDCFDATWSADGALHRLAAARRHDVVIAVSQTVANSLDRRVPHGSLVIVPNGVEPDAVPALARSESTPLVVWCGRLQRWKGAHLFLQAASRVVRDHPHARFAIVGGTLFGMEPDYPAELRALTDRLGIATAVEFAGHVEDARPWLAAASVVVHSSIAPEPFGLVVAEAMMQARPVVAFGHGGPAEMVIDQETGCLCTPGDVEALASAIASLVASPSRATSLGAAGRLRALSQYHAATMVRGIEAAYDRTAA